jgi:hypothetical protein
MFYNIWSCATFELFRTVVNDPNIVIKCKKKKTTTLWEQFPNQLLVFWWFGTGTSM